MPKTIEIVSAKILDVRISEARRKGRGPQGEEIDEGSAGKAIIVKYGLVEKPQKEGDPESIIKVFGAQFLEGDLTEDAQKAFNTFMAKLQAEVDKKEGL